jgi:hypothetical protein
MYIARDANMGDNRVCVCVYACLLLLLLLQVAYSRMLFLQRKKLHRVIAEYLSKANEHQEVQAHHWMLVLEGVTEPDQEVVQKALKCIQQSIVVAQTSNTDVSEWKAKGLQMAALLADPKAKGKWTKEFS